MAHTPEHPLLYVCANCQVMHAGTVVGRDAGEHQYEAPDSCGACGESDFVKQDIWPRHHE